MLMEIDDQKREGEVTESNIKWMGVSNEDVKLECYLFSKKFTITEFLNNEEVIQSNNDILINTNLTNQNNTGTMYTVNEQEMS